MDITGVGQRAAASRAEEKSSLSTLTERFDNFLQLLTKQLQYQDPLSPLDTNEFTAQLVQFTGVEQAINTNNKLDELIALQGVNQSVDAIALLGTQVEAESTELWLPAGGQSEIRYELGETAAKTTILVLDASGKPVRVEPGVAVAGRHAFVWDGRDNAGAALPEGVYSIEVAAVDKDGKATRIDTATLGRVTGVELRDGDVVLSIGGLEVPVDRIRAVRPGTAGAPA